MSQLKPRIIKFKQNLSELKFSCGTLTNQTAALLIQSLILPAHVGNRPFTSCLCAGGTSRRCPQRGEGAAPATGATVAAAGGQQGAGGGASCSAGGRELEESAAGGGHEAAGSAEHLSDQCDAGRTAAETSVWFL